MRLPSHSPATKHWGSNSASEVVESAVALSVVDSSVVPSQLPSQAPSTNPPVLGQWLLSWTQSHEYAVMSMLRTSPSKQLRDLPPPADLLLQENPSMQPLVIHTCPSHSQSAGLSSKSLHSTLKAPGHCWPSTRLMHTTVLNSKLGLMI